MFNAVRVIVSMGVRKTAAKSTPSMFNAVRVIVSMGARKTAAKSTPVPRIASFPDAAFILA